MDRPDAVAAYKCQECDEIRDEAGPALYECSNDDTKFSKNNGGGRNGNACPQCNKFASKLSATSCVVCEEGEVDEVQAYLCEECDELFEGDDYDDHMEKRHVQGITAEQEKQQERERNKPQVEVGRWYTLMSVVGLHRIDDADSVLRDFCNGPVEALHNTVANAKKSWQWDVDVRCQHGFETTLDVAWLYKLTEAPADDADEARIKAATLRDADDASLEELEAASAILDQLVADTQAVIDSEKPAVLIQTVRDLQAQDDAARGEVPWGGNEPTYEPDPVTAPKIVPQLPFTNTKPLPYGSILYSVRLPMHDDCQGPVRFVGWEKNLTDNIFRYFVDCPHGRRFRITPNVISDADPDVQYRSRVFLHLHDDVACVGPVNVVRVYSPGDKVDVQCVEHQHRRSIRLNELGRIIEPSTTPV